MAVTARLSGYPGMRGAMNEVVTHSLHWTCLLKGGQSVSCVVLAYCRYLESFPFLFQWNPSARTSLIVWMGCPLKVIASSCSLRDGKGAQRQILYGRYVGD